MLKKCSAALLLFVLSVGFQDGASRVKEVEIVLGDGTKFKAEILAVRDSSIVVARKAGMPGSDLREDPHATAVLAFSRIDVVRITGNSYTMVGLFGGMALGCLGGCAIGGNIPVDQQKDDALGCNSASERASNQLTGSLGGGFGGAILGAAIGAAASGKDQDLISTGHRDFQVLKSVARYPAGEPDFLKSLAP